MKIETLSLIVGKPVSPNMRSFLAGMDSFPDKVMWHRPEAQAMVISQVGHESLGFVYDREIWGPTSTQLRYEDRADLGHSAAVPGEARMFAGHGPLQLTGRFNHRAFTVWVRKLIPDAPDFEKNPELVLTDPYEGLSVVFYWDQRGLNKYSLTGDLENLTQAVNGGLNGYADRIRYYARASLVLLGYPATGVKVFQAKHGLTVDDSPGPKTRAKLHEELKKLPDDRPITIPQSAPILTVEERLARIERQLGIV